MLTKQRILENSTLAIVLTFSLLALPAQDKLPVCRALGGYEAYGFFPGTVPLETGIIPVAIKYSSVIQFPDKSRVGIAPLIACGFGPDISERYQFVLASETNLVLDGQRIPAGLVGLGMEMDTEAVPLIRVLVALDLSGKEIASIKLHRYITGPSVPLQLVPNGSNQFELRLGNYVVQGVQTSDMSTHRNPSLQKLDRNDQIGLWNPVLPLK